MIILNNKKIQKVIYDDRVNILKNKIVEFNKSLELLNIQKDNIVNSLQYSVELYDREIYLNNLELVFSLIQFYNNNKIFIEELLLEYYDIISDENKVVKISFIEIWKNKVDSYLKNESNLFNYTSSSENNVSLLNSNLEENETFNSLLNNELSNKKIHNRKILLNS